MKHTTQTIAALAAILTTGCVNFAAPSPLATLGGPATTPAGESELGIAVGGGGVSSGVGDGSGNGALLRWRYGVSDSLDLGFDGVYARYGANDAVSVKAAARYQIAPQWRFEAGIGAADTARGRGTNTELGITWGTRSERPWNYYTSLRGGTSRGEQGRYLFHFDDDPADDAPPDSVFGVLAFGMQGQARNHRRFVWEAGVGVVDPDGADSATLFYLTAGVLLNK